MAGTLLEASMTWPGQQELQLCLTSEFGSAIQCAAARDGVTLGRLDLAPGIYGLQVTGNASPDTRYDVRVGPDVPRSPDGESEPNDVDDAADVVGPSGRDARHLARRRRGPLPRPPARRGCRRSGASRRRGPDLAQLEWRQPDDTHVGSVRIAADGMSATIEDLYLVSGDHLLTVRGGGDYELSMSSLGAPDPAAEREPNDVPDRAGALAMDGERTGRLPPGGDVDVYRFSLAAPEHVIITARPTTGHGGALDAPGGALDLEITSATTSLATVAAPATGGETVFDGVLQQGDYEVSVRAATDAQALLPPPDLGYAIRLARGDPFRDPAVPAPDALDAELALSVEDPVVAAYWQDGQRVDALLRLTASAPLELGLDAAASHHAWWVELPERSVGPGPGTTEVPITIHVPPDAWRDVPVRLTVRARTTDGAQATAFTDITPVQDVLPVAPEQVWPIPDALLGGLDVASLALGGVPLNGYYGEEQLHDGLSIAGDRHHRLHPDRTAEHRRGPGRRRAGARGGDHHRPPRGRGHLRGATAGLRAVAVTRWHHVHPRADRGAGPADGRAAVHAAGAGARAIRAAAHRFPVGRHARRRGPRGVEGHRDPRLRAIRPTRSTSPIRGRGAHVVWSEPAMQPAYEMLSTTDVGIRQLALDAGQPQELVIGFSDDRAAQITGLRWQDPAGSVPAARLSSVSVSVSLDSPLGPWLDLGTWDLARAADGTAAPFDLPEPTWARFVRLSAVGSPDEFGYWELPGKVAILRASR